MNGVVKVLIVEDEESYVDALELGLAKEGFLTHVARTGSEAISLFDRVAPDLVLLDLMLPGVSGIEVCRQIRRRSGVPVIIVTARDSELDTVVGLEVGADDYVTKPYRLRELVARMRAVLRRMPDGPPPTSSGLLEIGDVRLDIARHEVSVRGARVELPRKEFDLLQLLMANAGRLLTREAILDEVWGGDYIGDSKTLDVHIKRLRAKIEPDAARRAYITTVRGIGYRFETVPDRSERHDA